MLTEVVDFMAVKYVHVTCVALTFISFSLRGYWMIKEVPLLQQRAAKTIPHIIDATLLTSGVFMATIMYGAFYEQTWLLIKLLILLLYIILGSIALRYGKSRQIRIVSLIGAWCAFFCIIILARNHAAFTIWINEI